MAGLRQRSAIKNTAGDKTMLVFFYVISFAFAVACLFPFILVIISSFTDEATLVREGYSMWPSKWSINAYKAMFTSSAVIKAYGITTFVTVVGTFLSLLVTCMAAYAIGGKKIRYGNTIAFIFYFTMLFSGGLVPTYVLISRYLGMRNSIWVYILPVLVNPWNMFLLRNFFNTIPESFRESAALDGANEFVIMFRIMLPLALPALATISLFYALGYWNIWMESMLYMDSPDMHTLQYMIMKIIRNIDSAKTIAKQSSATIPVPPAYTIRYATAIVTIGPIILLYPFLQRYFVSGLKVGGVKG